ncbi:hypothetical protein NE237_021759 [Protea cynaroides]|uniref:Uncharacterized protein n=1 Tax=Protea cynaroides TaxID=273540 RepID=A0A9Q0K2W9_9MAGN|nr:hypothetical protein NE237_021759 [Protea cynaroides]
MMSLAFLGTEPGLASVAESLIVLKSSVALGAGITRGLRAKKLDKDGATLHVISPICQLSLLQFYISGSSLSDKLPLSVEHSFLYRRQALLRQAKILNIWWDDGDVDEVEEGTQESRLQEAQGEDYVDLAKVGLWGQGELREGGKGKRVAATEKEKTTWIL